MHIEFPLDGMTWGELRAFVALGKNKSDTDEVDYDYDYSSDERMALALLHLDYTEVTTARSRKA